MYICQEILLCQDTYGGILLFLCVLRILWHVYALLGNDSEIRNNKTTVAK
jgi:hypothetical protein